MKKLLTLTLLLFCSSAFADTIYVKKNEAKRMFERGFNIADAKILEMINKDKNGCKKYVNTDHLEKHYFIPDSVDIPDHFDVNHGDDEGKMDKMAKKWMVYMLNGVSLKGNLKSQMKSCRFILDDIKDICRASIKQSEQLSINDEQAIYIP